MSDIHVKTLLEALECPSTLKALSRKTGYPIQKVGETIIEARSKGYIIMAHPRLGERTYYERMDDGGNENT